MKNSGYKAKSVFLWHQNNAIHPVFAVKSGITFMPSGSHEGIHCIKKRLFVFGDLRFHLLR